MTTPPIGRGNLKISGAARDPYLDSLRGVFHVAMVTDHLPYLLPGLFTLITWVFEFLGYVSAAEGFVFLSGFVSGLVYTRIGHEQGRVAMWSKAVLRSRNIYLTYLAAVLSLLVFIKWLGPARITWSAWDFLIEDPLPTAALKAAAILVQPTFLEILPLYSCLLLLTPLLITQLDRGRTQLIMAMSLGIWVAAQFDVRTRLLGLLLFHDSIHPGYFNLIAWQLLFVTGLCCGHRTFTLNRPWLPGGRVLAFGTSAIVLILFMLRHGLLPFVPAGPLVDRSILGPLRLLDFFGIAFLVCRCRPWLENIIAWKGFSLLSRNSLPVFAFHLLPIYLASLLLPNRTPLPAWIQLSVVATSVASLFLIAIYSNVFGAINSRIKERFPLASWYALIVGLLACLCMEWLRNPGGLSAGQFDCRQDCIDLVLSPFGRLVLLALLVIGNLFPLWRKYHDRFGNPGLWNNMELRDKFKLAIVALATLAFFHWPAGNQQAGNVDSLLLGIDQSTNILILIFGILISQMVDLGLARASREKFRLSFHALVALVVFLAMASLTRSDPYQAYKYLDQVRWTGLWVNPNTAGLLMGVGFLLACGLAVLPMASFVFIKKSLAGLALCLTGAGLFHSYSRGAWLATLCGLSYFGCQAAVMSTYRRPIFRWLRANGLALAVVVMATVALADWTFRDSACKPLRRIFSALNTMDFSWRNRAEAWQGALAMIGDRPLTGFGWNHPEPVYDNYYRPFKVEEGFAIELNDYLTIGITAGLPMLAGFAGLLAVYLTVERSRDSLPYDWLRMTCRSGLVVLLVGFWFDGGLFKLALSVPFWLLLELGFAGKPTKPLENH